MGLKKGAMIQDKVVAITGASSGIGEATARVLAAAGAKVVLGARRVERIERIAAELGGVARATDVTKREDLAALVALGLERFGKLDVLVSNAGIAKIGPLDDVAIDDWLAMMDVNVNGFLYGIAAALPVFRRQGFGHFVTTISTSGLRIVARQAIYAGTKNAVRTIHEGLRLEAGPNLRVTGISPGYVRTELAAASIEHAETRAEVEAQLAKIALAPEAIARAIAFAIDQPADVDVGDIVVRPTAQA
jgi:NADP-dependent 3-hydroxy acid dehydrogenase YdfG